jgi:hypothetical protein
VLWTGFVWLRIGTVGELKNGVFWDVTPCGSYIDDGGAKVLRNVGSYKSHTP